MSEPADPADPDERLALTLWEELDAMGKNFGLPSFTATPRPACPTLATIYKAIANANPPLSALCLSGGGIRSAAFALGLLQTLARYGVLRRFDYLSTVSGGGYIGGFLTAWRKQASVDTSVWQGLDRGHRDDGREAPQIAGLRADSNYLTPKLGLLSADTWTVLALVVRNLVLNWVVFLPFFMAVLLIPWLCRHLLVAMPAGSAPCWLAGGAVCILVGLTAASFGRRYAHGKCLTNGFFVLCVLVPIAVAGMGFSAAAAALSHWQEADPPPGGCGWLAVCQWVAGVSGLTFPPASWLPYADAAAAGAVCWGLAWAVASVALAVVWHLRGHTQLTRETRSDHKVWDFVVWMGAGALSAIVLAKGLSIAAQMADMTWLTVFGVSWTMLSIFAGELVYVGVRSYSPRGDMDREWLARAAGWLGAWAVTWSVASAVALLGPVLLWYANDNHWVSRGFTAAGGISGLTALILGGSGGTAATKAASDADRLSLTLTQIASAAALVFALVLAILIAWLDVTAGLFAVAKLATLMPGGPQGVGYWLEHPSAECKPMRDFAGAVVLAGFSVGVSLFINVNRFSLHAVYRNRLVRAFLGSGRLVKRGRTPDDSRDPFTNFDPCDNPWLKDMRHAPLFPVINVALNVVSTDNLAWQERKAESFTLTPLHAGNPLVRYRPMRMFGGKDGLTLGTAMAISGAAVSPNMGYHSSPLLGLLLMLFNVRLGWWLGNPAGNHFASEGPTFGLLTLLKELTNFTTADGRWIYLSDGGHFDNLGIYEMVRRRCRFIVVSDAGSDPKAALEDLGNAVRKASIDFGVRIRFDDLDVLASDRPPTDGPFAWRGRISYPGCDEPGWLLYLRPTYRGTEAADIRAYAMANPSFPHESTAEQWFSESQFEAYRALGAHQMELLCGNAGVRHPVALDLEGLRNAAEKCMARPGGQ